MIQRIRINLNGMEIELQEGDKVIAKMTVSHAALHEMFCKRDPGVTAEMRELFCIPCAHHEHGIYEFDVDSSAFVVK